MRTAGSNGCGRSHSQLGDMTRTTPSLQQLSSLRRAGSSASDLRPARPDADSGVLRPVAGQAPALLHQSPQPAPATSLHSRSATGTKRTTRRVTHDRYLRERLHRPGTIGKGCLKTQDERQRSDPQGSLAGLAAASSDWCIVMDGDLQHPPEVIPVLLRSGAEQDADVVVASHQRRILCGSERAGASTCVDFGDHFRSRNSPDAPS